MGWPNIDAGDAPSLVIISACRRGLVGGDKETSPVQLIHFLSLGVHYLRAPPDPLVQSTWQLPKPTQFI